MGMKYGISLMELLNLSGGSPSKADSAEYFCSQLVASAFMAMRLLPETAVASKYFPGSFSADRKLQLENGAALGQEYLIDFARDI